MGVWAGISYCVTYLVTLTLQVTRRQSELVISQIPVCAATMGQVETRALWPGDAVICTGWSRLEKAPVATISVRSRASGLTALEAGTAIHSAGK